MFSSNTSRVSADANYIEDVFSTYLYTGNSSTQTITNGIDLSTKGGLVWIKGRSTAGTSHSLYDTSRGVQKVLNTNTSGAQGTQTDGLTTFNTNGFVVSSNGDINESPRTYASWTFRKQAKFFDIVTYTGNGATTQTINHSLGAVPGCIIAKGTSNATDWPVYHRSLNGGTTPEQWYLRLNATSAQSNAVANWGNVAPTSTTFTVGDNNNVNGYSYVAYLFAHDAGGFGLTGTDNVISCGSFTTNGSGNATVTLGYEPQWVMYKRTDTTGNWFIADVMRGWSLTDENNLILNTSGAEGANSPGPTSPTATGFTVATNVNATFIYIAIRRGPMKVPTSGTSVFSPITYAGNGTGSRVISGLINAPDWVLYTARNASAGLNSHITGSRLQGGGRYLLTEGTGVEASSAAYGVQTYGQTSVTLGTATTAEQNASGVNYILYGLGRAPGFFDVVCWTSTGTDTVTHNLKTVPELIIRKRRDSTSNWVVYVASLGADKRLLLEGSGASDTNLNNWQNTTPTESVFYSGNTINTGTYVAYLFATCPGVSKVGSYTGSGTTKQIDCGFTNGARFVLIKRTDSTGDWYVWDTARGIVSGNDPYLLLNSDAAEITNTDYIDTYSAGFELSSTAPAALNANGGSYIFLAIA